MKNEEDLRIMVSTFSWPRGSPDERTTWHRAVMHLHRKWERRWLGPLAPPRKRPRRIQKKIDARGGAARCRDAPFRLGQREVREAVKRAGESRVCHD